jgi:hypothetical protein
MDIYKIPENLSSPFCSFTESDNKFYESSTDSVINCCYNLCKIKDDFCYKKCKKNDCYECVNMSNVCKQSCNEITSKGLDIIKNCASENGCGTFPIFDRDCLDLKRNEIINCSKNNCTDNNIDCKIGNWNSFYNILNTNSNKKTIQSSYNKSSTLFIIYIIGIIIFSLILIKMKIKH